MTTVWIYVNTSKQGLPNFRVPPIYSVLLYLFDQTALADADLLSA
jgi:hypothetical protein